LPYLLIFIPKKIINRTNQSRLAWMHLPWENGYRWSVYRLLSQLSLVSYWAFR